MITRIWHGRTSAADAAEYLQFLLREGTNDYRETPGNLSVRVWQKKEGDVCHFWTVTEWRDLESIKAFAGDDYEKAVYYSFKVKPINNLGNNLEVIFKFFDINKKDLYKFNSPFVLQTKFQLSNHSFYSSSAAVDPFGCFDKKYTAWYICECLVIFMSFTEIFQYCFLDQKHISCQHCVSK